MVWQGNGETVVETIGSGAICGPDDVVCNGPLRPGTQYQFKYRVYTSDDDNSFVESQYSGPISTGTIKYFVLLFEFFQIHQAAHLLQLLL